MAVANQEQEPRPGDQQVAPQSNGDQQVAPQSIGDQPVAASVDGESPENEGRCCRRLRIRNRDAAGRVLRAPGIRAGACEIVITANLPRLCNPPSAPRAPFHHGVPKKTPER